MKGYKAFNKDWTCCDKQYKVGETFEEAVSLIPCRSGMHFCKRLVDVFRFYPFARDLTVVAEVEAIGDVKTDDNIKFCTNKLLIVRELSWDEVLKDCNTGNFNTGGWNTGNFNTGIRNAGDGNTGNFNTGDWNTGNFNTGDWNKSSFNNGCFMTIAPKITMFNKPSDWTLRDWLNSKAYFLLAEIPKTVVKCGYADYTQLWWNRLCQEDRNVILALPNFDPVIFKECTGIDVNKEV